jgi:hypothetical protein
VNGALTTECSQGVACIRAINTDEMMDSTEKILVLINEEIINNGIRNDHKTVRRRDVP